MKKQILIMTFLSLAISWSAHAKIKNLNEIMSKVTSDEKRDLGKLLQQFRIVPAKDPETKESVFKVVWVQPGSVFDREGLKPGDLVRSNNTIQPSKKMELRKTQKSKAQGQ